MRPYGEQRRERETGLYYLRSRWYDAQFAHFVSEDPIGLSGGINPYAYAGHDSVNAGGAVGGVLPSVGSAVAAWDAYNACS